MSLFVSLSSEARRPEREYALATLLDVAGLPFQTLPAGAHPVPSGGVRLHYGAAPDPEWEGLAIPHSEVRMWRPDDPQIALVDGVPVLHAGSAPAALLHGAGKAVHMLFDPVQAAFWLLSRQEELGDTGRDRFDRFEEPTSLTVRNGFAEMPLLNQYSDLLLQALTLAAAACQTPLLRKARWPNRRRYAVVLSHDVDDAGRSSPAQGIALLAKGVRRGSPRATARGAYLALAALGRRCLGQPDPYWNFGALTALEATAGFRSTFFFVPESSNPDRDPPYDMLTPRMRRLAKQLRQDGWEIGVHGSFDSYLSPQQLGGQRQRLQEVSGAQVDGIRQHYLRLRVPDTWRAQAAAGFTYDATLGYRTGIGFRAGAAFPFHPFDTAAGESLPLLELPLTVMDGALFWQLKLTPQQATDRVLALLDTVRSVGGLAVLLWHQRVRYEKRYPGWWRVYRQIVEHLQGEAEAWVATAGQVAEWWLAREALQMDAQGTGEGGWRWRCRAARSIAPLSLELRGAAKQRVSVTGVPCSMEAAAGESRWLHLDPLSEGQDFVITVEGRA